MHKLDFFFSGFDNCGEEVNSGKILRQFCEERLFCQKLGSKKVDIFLVKRKVGSVVFDLLCQAGDLDFGLHRSLADYTNNQDRHISG